ncbi:hypothetical protein HYC85_028671 [Camellia sinensis]|uniref:Uncharacterized protein n=1 Tax=Camellia sinensis TaxID=4442 RepID=A0A7J7FVS2_CAMSI|nr:hypothetical protein HYC85_028671 [Camellia sinensis]
MRLNGIVHLKIAKSSSEPTQQTKQLKLTKKEQNLSKRLRKVELPGLRLERTIYAGPYSAASSFPLCRGKATFRGRRPFFPFGARFPIFRSRRPCASVRDRLTTSVCPGFWYTPHHHPFQQLGVVFQSLGAPFLRPRAAGPVVFKGKLLYPLFCSYLALYLILACKNFWAPTQTINSHILSSFSCLIKDLLLFESCNSTPRPSCIDMRDWWHEDRGLHSLKSSGDSVSGKAVHVWHFFQNLFSQNDLLDLDSLVQIKNRDNLSPNCSEPQMNRTGLVPPGAFGNVYMGSPLLLQRQFGHDQTCPPEGIEYPATFPVRGPQLAQYATAWRTRELLAPAPTFNCTLSDECLDWLNEKAQEGPTLASEASTSSGRGSRNT